jgi:hypothetical protein
LLKKYKTILLIIGLALSVVYAYFQNGKIEELMNKPPVVDTVHVQGNLILDTVTVTKEVIKLVYKVDTVDGQIVTVPYYDTVYVQVDDVKPSGVVFFDKSNRFVDVSGKVNLPSYVVDLSYKEKFDLKSFDGRFRFYAGVAYIDRDSEKGISLYAMSTYRKYNLGLMYGGKYTGVFVGKQF